MDFAKLIKYQHELHERYNRVTCQNLTWGEFLRRWQPNKERRWEARAKRMGF